MTDALTDAPTELALFEALSLECRIDEYGFVCYRNSNGELHRVYGPAIENPDGYRAWYQNGQLHRLDGPAIEWADSRRAWWQNGQLHRLDGPAIEYSNGACAWHQNGRLHRLDGPAFVDADGNCGWYINDKELTETEWQHAVSMEHV
jgi:hypothetical protein